MPTAKLFMNGRSQAVRLPREFRFNGDVVYIRRDEKTGDVILSERPDSWNGFYEVIDKMDDDIADFLVDRDNRAAQERDL